MTIAQPTLAWTGERCIPEATPDGFLWVLREHVARYRWASERIATLPRNQVVLDAPSGSGYGTALLAENPKIAIAVGVDIDAESVEYARARYGRPPRLNYQVGDMTSLRPRSANVVVCFEGIEHVQDEPAAARSLCEALKPGGVLFVSTPRVDGPAAGSIFHTHELTLEELIDLFAPHLASYAVLGQDQAVGDSPTETARYFILEGRARE